jgi:6-pyruvoyltetrahydropterin/6-carboxytetrahydropterin synthase
MTFTIRKRFTFAASHQLGGLPEDHQCARLHGHNYVVWLELASDRLVAPGFVRDFGELKRFKAYLDGALDHRHLNDVLDCNPTAELLAWHLYEIADDLWDGVVAVAVEETETSWAEYRP